MSIIWAKITFYTCFIASSWFRYWYPRCLDLETSLERSADQGKKVIKMTIQVSNIHLTDI